MEVDTVSAPAQTVTERFPRTHVDSQPLPTDSMVTVPLSETGTDASPAEEDDDARLPKILQPELTSEEKRSSSRPSSAEIMQAFGTSRDTEEDLDTSTLNSPTISLNDEKTSQEPSGDRSRSDSRGSDSDRSAHVDWEELEKKEEQEPEGEGNDEAMALLLARLDQENNAISADPKSAVRSVIKGSRARGQSRPPSMHQLKRLVSDESASHVRFSQLPSPPPMTELDFWSALVRDYPQTVQRLPTLTLNKIRGGIPAPLRGVVWQSAAGARDKLIEEQYETLCGESSPYENIINKDLGRSFPGVEMFKDPEGEGQKMMGRVLKCFSLYDNKIGYCQGLGFLVGPLLMQMGDREAFCVLVRLMEDYDLRSCFLPDLSGLHLRIFQFQKLLCLHMPNLARHLEDLGVESAYLSQWFLSFFAVTCPLPMLFRIYDVLFAEGASETIMRVALALMKRNEQKILALAEFEDVMQLLLGRSLWDPYGLNTKSADVLVSDFVSFTNDVTKESLQNLEAAFRESQKGTSKEVQKSATSFLGRLWPISTSSTKSVSLSPGLSAPSRPGSFLRRTPSKQSLASTLNSEKSDTSTGTQSTAATEVSRGSSGDARFTKQGHESVALSIRTADSSKDRDLHYQIEQLLMSVSQLQRQNSELDNALQKQQEDRKEDHRIVRTVLDKMRRKTSTLSAPTTRESRRRTTITAATLSPPSDESSSEPVSEEVKEVAAMLDTRFPSHQAHHRASSMFETKAMLKDSLSRTKEQLSSETIRANSLARELADAQTELQISRDALKETRQRLQESYNTNQRHEKTIQELRTSSRKGSTPWAITTSNETPEASPTLSRSNTAESTVSTTGGLRELRLGRSGSQKSITRPEFSKRSSSLATQTILSTENHAPADNEALLLELVNAKTAEAVAKQELEELRSKFDGMRKAMGLSGGSSPQSTPPPTIREREVEKPTIVTPAPSTGGWGWGGWKRTVSSNNVNAS
ncbi:hypothetical protein BU24DRAFT_12966 [Aaosphaeria arxii CBS 175.79]|uniref:Rab-GAP TBC domain-containing protein n=1 Tax=Aaosphaeria arxii CBS 175.79 TaxID=1450172 RepID=A0A6A5Y657_9PLEO|nr:uncharacterized protein BU24DRAFT_12966 [Aaosphaeria arxii CBS 175.79]KAF2020998.1 hypothetical protein BU24DRAFT_12966 [Aaosphaeria arxii CBS 175.79]